MDDNPVLVQSSPDLSWNGLMVRVRSWPSLVWSRPKLEQIDGCRSGPVQLRSRSVLVQSGSDLSWDRLRSDWSLLKLNRTIFFCLFQSL